jgi:hypothetical protein
VNNELLIARFRGNKRWISSSPHDAIAFATVGWEHPGAIPVGCCAEAVPFSVAKRSARAKSDGCCGRRKRNCQGLTSGIRQILLDLGQGMIGANRLDMEMGAGEGEALKAQI